MKKRLDTKNTVIPYILQAISTDGFDVSVQPTTDKEKLKFLAQQFRSYNYANNVKYFKGNYCDMMSDWMQGLPSSFNVAFANYEILQIAVKWESIPENATEKQQDKVIENWFNLISYHTIRLFEKHKIEYRLSK